MFRFVSLVSVVLCVVSVVCQEPEAEVHCSVRQHEVVSVLCRNCFWMNASNASLFVRIHQFFVRIRHFFVLLCDITGDEGVGVGGV